MIEIEFTLSGQDKTTLNFYLPRLQHFISYNFALLKLT